jgi:hypothetical protein
MLLIDVEFKESIIKPLNTSYLILNLNPMLIKILNSYDNLEES